MRIGMLAPMPSELRPVIGALGLRRRAAAAGRTLHEGRLGGAEVTAAVTGIGTVAAAAATRRMLDAGRIDHLVVVGVAGGIDDHLAIGDVVVPVRVIDGASGAEFRPHPLARTVR
jgi:adenosylhomocysteine nucleosidase